MQAQVGRRVSTGRQPTAPLLRRHRRSRTRVCRVRVASWSPTRHWCERQLAATPPPRRLVPS